MNSALNLDLTVNPDFSQVEVDQQVTNLDRFEIFFPERRQFFLENADLFANFGVDGSRPFFSRRIGVARDTSTGQNIQNTIYAGARLSGKINNNLRIGVMTMQAGKDASIGLPSTNYSLISLQQKLFARSNVGLIFVNKQAVADSLGGEFTFSPNEYNRIIGIDYNLLSKDNRWNGKVFYHQSFDEQQQDSTFYPADLSGTQRRSGKLIGLFEMSGHITIRRWGMYAARMSCNWRQHRGSTSIRNRESFNVMGPVLILTWLETRNLVSWIGMLT